MALLFNKTKNQLIVQKLETASSFMQRLVGLIGKRELSNAGLWIPSCSSIHTCFMRFPIDLAFVNDEMKVIKVMTAVKPWRFVVPVGNAYGVFELPKGVGTNITLGDILHVDANFNR